MRSFRAICLTSNKRTIQSMGRLHVKLWKDMLMLIQKNLPKGSPRVMWSWILLLFLLCLRVLPCIHLGILLDRPSLWKLRFRFMESSRGTCLESTMGSDLQFMSHIPHWEVKSSPRYLSVLYLHSFYSESQT